MFTGDNCPLKAIVFGIICIILILIIGIMLYPYGWFLAVSAFALCAVAVRYLVDIFGDIFLSAKTKKSHEMFEKHKDSKVMNWK
jgi:ABC-type multidrug transport system permease subunit